MTANVVCTLKKDSSSLRNLRCLYRLVL